MWLFYLPVIPYQLQVFTGKEKDSNTDADVFVTIYGNHGNTGKRKLHKNDEGVKPFDKPEKVGGIKMEVYKSSFKNRPTQIKISFQILMETFDK